MRSFKNIIAARTKNNYQRILNKINALSTCPICYYRFSKSRVAVSCENEHLICHLCVRAANKSVIESDELDPNLRLRCAYCRKGYKFRYPKKNNRQRSFMELASTFKLLIKKQKDYNTTLKNKYLQQRNQYLKTKKNLLQLQKLMIEKADVIEAAETIIATNSPPSSPDIIILGSPSPSTSHLRQVPVQIPTVRLISDNSIPPTAPYASSTAASLTTLSPTTAASLDALTCDDLNTFFPSSTDFSLIDSSLSSTDSAGFCVLDNGVVLDLN